MPEKYVFLDRDGVINKDGEGFTEHGYITRWEDFHFLPGVLDALKKLKEHGYRCVIISNQQGVGKGYYSQRELDEVTARMIGAVREAGGDIAGIYYCTHTKEEECDCRKPKAGLFYKAKEELGIKDLAGKFYVGDTERDISAGKEAGLVTVTVLSGKSAREDLERWQAKPDHICEGLSGAVDVIIRGEE